MHPTGIPVDAEAMLDQPLFDRLDAASIGKIAQGGWVVEFERGARVLGRGEQLGGLYVLLDGRLKLYMLSCNGDERVLRVMSSGDSFGEAIMFNELPSPVFVDTLSAARLAFFPRDVITDALMKNPEFTTSMLRSMSVLMRNLIQDLETCCLQNALQRTANYLLREARNSPPPHVALTLPAPKAVIASTLNLSAETFSRELHRLKDHGVIEINRRVIYLRDKAALVALAEGSQFAVAAAQH
ncbi:MAG: Crp/Fnr family transcriptional regulator [Gammaproteobacteria bacterium]|nr:Crp/Fnr family transcriptional regulator [Gammaproteobacteria bacterium]